MRKIYRVIFYSVCVLVTFSVSHRVVENIFTIVYAGSIFSNANTSAPYTTNSSYDSMDCDFSSYPDFCIAYPPPNLNCDDVDGKDFKVFPPDPHGFDRDKDGEGCETSE